jgi:hypothetical protein
LEQQELAYLPYQTVKTTLLRNAETRSQALGSGVEQVAKTFPVDGLWMDQQGGVCLSGLNQSAVFLLKNGRLEKLVSDQRLGCPDTFTQGPDGAMYITASHINDSPQFNNGKSTRRKPYAVFRFMP